MDNLKMHSINKVDDNVKKIAELFPNCVTEHKDENGNIVLGVDFDMLKQELSTVVIDSGEERCQFTWPDKKQAVLTANAPISKTLRPCREESVDFDNTENLYIEGDNLDVLKLLQETYLGKIKMIYIDPPYNTGNDFVYNDDFAEDADDYIGHSGQYDEEGNRLVQNTESNGRFHTDWLNMIYPRLKLAKDLLTDDGVIFISIDDNEVENLKKICNEIFGEENLITSFVWQKKTSGGQGARFSLDFHEYVLCFAKSISSLDSFLVKRTEEQKKSFKLEDEYVKTRGKYLLSPFQSWLDYRPNLIYPIEMPDGTIIRGIQWTHGKESFLELKEEGRIEFKKTKNGWTVYKKQYENDKSDGVIPPSVISIAQSSNGTKDFGELFDNKLFSNPKPIKLISYFLEMIKNKDCVILDFFSGSATTAHAVMQLNAEDGGSRKFIMVQLPEPTDDKSEAYKAGYKNICEIGKERIRRAGKKIIDDAVGETIDIAAYGENYDVDAVKDKYKELDIGFRVLKLDSSNMKDVYYNPNDYEPDMFASLADNIKEDRSPEDLLFQVMLDLGILLSSKIEETTIAGKKVFDVADGFLIACFDENITDEVITEIAKKQPYYYVMRDSSIANDSVATNFEQIFKTYSPDTVRKVL